MDLMTLVSNADTATVRHETLEGRPHVVVPVVMMTEGVHKGSGGSVLYNAQHLGACPSIWDHKPIVVYHPEIDGKGASACDPVILNKQKVGIMLHTAYEDKLKCEAWIDIDRANAVDLRVMQAINNKKMMEVSTGVYVDLKNEAGEWQGEKYVGSAENLRADHLALLPDQKGACSIADGAGLLRNSAAPEDDSVRRLDSIISGLITNKKLIANAMSFSNIREALQVALYERLQPTPSLKSSINSPTGRDWWLEDVYPSFCVYEQNGAFYKLEYTIADNKVTLSKDTPEEVVKVTEYRTVGGTYIGNSEQGTHTIMTKPELVSKLITNGGWKEGDRAYLMNQSEDDLKRYPLKNSEEVPAKIDTPETPPIIVQPTAPIQNRQLTTDEFLAMAPTPIKTMITNALAYEKTEKKRLAVIVQNAKGNMFSKEYLEADERPITELQGLAALVQGGMQETSAQQGYHPPMLAPNYAGAAAGGIIGNAAPVTEEPLLPPSNPFAKKQ